MEIGRNDWAAPEPVTGWNLGVKLNWVSGRLASGRLRVQAPPLPPICFVNSAARVPACLAGTGAAGHVECRKDKDVIDETPAAYKDIDAVMEAQRDLVDVVHTLKQVVCVKG